MTDGDIVANAAATTAKEVADTLERVLASFIGRPAAEGEITDALCRALSGNFITFVTKLKPKRLPRKLKKKNKKEGVITLRVAVSSSPLFIPVTLSFAD